MWKNNFILSSFQRLPKSIPEVRCLCPEPPHTHPLLAEQFSCEPLYYDIQVLKFESNCRKFRPAIERISLGCVATRKPVRNLKLFSHTFKCNSAHTECIRHGTGSACRRRKFAIGRSNSLGYLKMRRIKKT